MNSNIFLTNPIKVVVFDPIKEVNRHTFIFLGDVPKNVWSACNLYHSAPSGRATADKILCSFYGEHFKNKLGLNIKDMTRGWIQRPEQTGLIGAAEPDQEIDYSDIEELLNAPSPAAGRPKPDKILFAQADESWVDFAPGIEYVNEIQIFPEDKFNEFKEKIYLATGIPAYRQHIFYISGNSLRTVYQIQAEGVYSINITQLSRFQDNIFGIPIDKSLYDLRESIRIEALDTFRILGDALIFDNVVYVVDLAQFTHRLRGQLLDIINDTYQFELLYYGFVIKFWPQLTQECFYDYLISERELQHKYPELAKNHMMLTSVYKLEKDIINTNYKNMTKALSACGPVISIAITQMVAMVNNPNIILNIRNLFDKLRVTRCTPEIHAYVEYNNKKYMLRKRHILNGSIIQFPSGLLMKNGITIAISLKKSDQDTFHNKSTISTMENEQSRYLFLNIWPNGKYYIKTVWNEEDEFGFDDIIKVMKKFTDPIIQGINNLGKYVFTAGRQLSPITRQNIDYQSLNICVFWKKVMLENTFKAVRGLWDAYMRARIIGPRNVQQFDKYEFLFRKGMFEFDTTAIDRIITASNNILLTNQYSYLSNNSVKQKWDQNYDGRIVRMSHRTTDIRFEISDIREREFQIFYNYIAAFIHRASNDENVKVSLQTTRTYKDVKKLKKLRQQDPELFNLKKYGSKKVYSKICQNQRQPLIYTQDEINTMSAAEVKKLTQYWNFTLSKPAYYGCPNKKYPHLNFMVGSHPRHYCLPCCNKKPQVDDDNKKSRIRSICMQKHRFFDDDASGDTALSRHIMAYGKDIDLGRLSKLPQSAVKGLLFDTLPRPGLDYYLYGVPQHVPAVEYSGLIYSIAECMEMPLEQLLSKILVELRRPTSKSLFNVLLNGVLIEYFRDINDLADTINDLFINMKIFSREIQKFKQWSELFTELFHIIFKISILTFIDADGAGELVELFVPDNVRNESMYIMKLSKSLSQASDSDDESQDESRPDHNLIDTLTRDQIYIFLMKRRNQYYPIFAIDTDKYFKSMAVESRKYSFGDKIVQLVFSMIRYEMRSESLSIGKTIDLTLIKAFTLATDYKITLKFINHQNLCYAVMLTAVENQIYVPIDYSIYMSDKVPISFAAFDRTKYRLEYRVLMRFISDINAYIQENYTIGGSKNLYTYRLIEPTGYFSVGDRSIIGLMASPNLAFYFSDYNAAEIDNNLTVKALMYDYTQVNQKIIERAPAVPDRRHEKIGEALYNNYIYQLFVIEFINFLNNERNLDIRSQIKNLIKETNFKKEVTAFRQSLNDLLKDYPADYKVIQNQLIAFYYTYFDKHTLFGEIDKFVYDFDRITMNKLKKMTRAELRAELKQISKVFSVQKDFDSTNISFPNIYLPCADMQDSGYCDRGKLIVNGPVDEFIEILADDLMDDLKAKYLLNIFMDVVIDWLRFAQYPTEIITIYRLTE